ncbi:OmpA family protein [Endozoicomonas numazuensis]|uniref:OmpA family protein n=1 Tax=Endozoicomonas numazuensis TaxID=1137799 RepID=UPI00191BE295|nr:OmpA family protein [Endozoicomonas numazuensis]
MLIQIKRMSLVVAAAAIVAGCQTTNPYTGEQEVNKTTKYGGIGAVTGAVIGGLVDGGEGALKGAAIGGAAGAGYGYYTDKQEAALRQQLQGTGVQVYRQGDNLQLIMPSNITFDSSKSDIKSSFYSVLGSVGKVFKEYDKNLIEVVGYTDSSGGDKINLPLSQERAKSVADYLIHQGVSGTRITYFGAGASNPIGDNKTKEGRAMNRRVEINLRPAPQK